MCRLSQLDNPNDHAYALLIIFMLLPSAEALKPSQICQTWQYFSNNGLKYLHDKPFDFVYWFSSPFSSQSKMLFTFVRSSTECEIAMSSSQFWEKKAHKSWSVCTDTATLTILLMWKIKLFLFICGVSSTFNKDCHVSGGGFITRNETANLWLNFKC